MPDSGFTNSQVLRHYALLRKLGEGAMGEVWLAHDKALDRDVAIKVLRGGDGSNDQRRMQEFVREARATAKLDHPNVVTVFDVGGSKGRVFLAMEYVARGSLADELQKQGALPWREATQAIRDAAAGLAAAHEAGLIHRDVKPSNLMRAKRGIVKVVDFGLAKALEADRTMTADGTIMGSPAYMSPEQCRGEPADARSDFYSLTCTYYQLLTRQLPFNGANLAALAYQHCHTAFPRISASPDGEAIPDGVRRILEKGSQKEPGDRYQTAGQMLADLEAVLHSPAVSLTFDGGQAAAPEKRPWLTPIFKGRGAAGKAFWIGVVLLAVAAIIIPLRSRLFTNENASKTAVALPLSGASGPAVAMPAHHANGRSTAIPFSPLALPQDPGLIRVLKGHVGTINDLDFLPDSWHLLTSSVDDKARYWNLATGEARELDHHASVSADGRWIFVVHDQFFNAADGSRVEDLKNLSAGGISAKARRFLPFRHSSQPALLFDRVRGTWILPNSFCSDDGMNCAMARDGVCVVVDAEARKDLAMTEKPPKGTVMPVAFSGDGRLVVLRNDRPDFGPLILWDWRAAREIELLHKCEFHRAVFSPDGRSLLTSIGWPFPSLALWDISDPSAPRKVWERTPSISLGGLAFSAGGARVLSGEGPQIMLLDAASGQQIWAFGDAQAIHKGMPELVAASPDGRIAASAYTGENEISVWRLPDPPVR